MRAVSVLALATLALPSCTFLSGDRQILVNSIPQGAAILVDDVETGLSTPAMVELGGFAAADHWITLRKLGYVDEKRKVTHYTTTHSSNWSEGAVDASLPSFPLFWTFGDMVLPFAVRWRYVPHEVYAQLYRPSEAPVQGEQDPGGKNGPLGPGVAAEGAGR